MWRDSTRAGIDHKGAKTEEAADRDRWREVVGEVKPLLGVRISYSYFTLVTLNYMPVV